MNVSCAAKKLELNSKLIRIEKHHPIFIKHLKTREKYKASEHLGNLGNM